MLKEKFDFSGILILDFKNVNDRCLQKIYLTALSALLLGVSKLFRPTWETQALSLIVIRLIVSLSGNVAGLHCIVPRIWILFCLDTQIRILENIRIR